MVDFHSHILPEIDDGSRSVAESLQMLRIMQEQEIHQVVATPHFYANHDNPERFLKRRAKALQKLKEAIGTEHLPAIFAGAEVHYFDGISDCEVLDALSIAGTSCVLVEMPMRAWSDRMYNELRGIYQKRGLTPIIAHVDRYISPFQTNGIPEQLMELPVLVQANAEFFTGLFTRSMALRMLRSGRIHLLGSDCHNLTDRKPNLGNAVQVIRKRLGVAALEEMARREKSILPD